MSSGQAQPFLPPAETQLGSKTGCFFGLRRWTPAPRALPMLWKSLGGQKGKGRCPPHPSCAFTQPCPGSGCSSWDAGHQFPPPQTQLISHPLPGAAVWHQKIVHPPRTCPPRSPGGDGAPGHPSGQPPHPRIIPKSLRSCRLNPLSWEDSKPAPALGLYSPSDKPRNPSPLGASPAYYPAAVGAL